jgi:hypothetical protein
MAKTKTQITTLCFNHGSEYQQPIFCPFTGIILLSENPSLEILDAEFPETLMAIWAGDLIEWDEPYFTSDLFKFDLDLFSDVGDIKNCAKLIDSLRGSEQYLFIDTSSYGFLPGDYGRCVYLLKIPNAYN